MMEKVKVPKKLIEVMMPMQAINAAGIREKSIRHGHPSTLHLWWARRPLAIARAVLFAQMVNDPGYQQGGGFRYGVNKKDAGRRRERLLKIIEELVKWENTENGSVLEEARAEIRKSWREICELNKAHPSAEALFNPEKLPGCHDPFAGGGAIPLEAQRLGLESYASDLNPVAVVINKALIEIPPRFVGKAPVGPFEGKGKQGRLNTGTGWPSDKLGLAEDVLRYGAWLIDEAAKRIGDLYPEIEITAGMVAERPDLAPYVGKKLTVIAWLWARTVKSSNPVYRDVAVPLVKSFELSKKKGNRAWVEPVVDGREYTFRVRTGAMPKDAEDGTQLSTGANFRCLFSGAPMGPGYIQGEFQAGRVGARLMAIVADGKPGRIYLSPDDVHEQIAARCQEENKGSDGQQVKLVGLCANLANRYGFDTYDTLFTARQLKMLTSFSGLVGEAIERCHRDALDAGWPEGESLDANGCGAKAYSEAVGVYLAFIVDKMADYHASVSSWNSSGEKLRNVFARQAIAMAWDFAEGNPFSGATGSAQSMLRQIVEVLERCTSRIRGYAVQADAREQEISQGKVVSTDPPYYDNICYADISDFFYVWLRKALKPVFPAIFATKATPKDDELIASPYRFKKGEAEAFFMDGMKKAIGQLAEKAHPAFPLTIYYAFKQTQKDEKGTTNVGWSAFLQALIDAGLVITGTWPMRTEMSSRMLAQGTNALASSIVLVCRKREGDAGEISRREFIRQLRARLPEALEELKGGGEKGLIEPVDLSQAIIGPGIEIFSQYAGVLNADGTRMDVRAALQLINRFLTASDFDNDTLFCLEWFKEYGWKAGDYGKADILAKSKQTSVEGLVEAGVVEGGKGKCRLLRYEEMPADWDPEKDKRLPVWEALHHMVQALKEDGEDAAGGMLAGMMDKADAVKQLAYRLHTVSEENGMTEDARGYNELVASWDKIVSKAQRRGRDGQQEILDIE